MLASEILCLCFGFALLCNPIGGSSTHGVFAHNDMWLQKLVRPNKAIIATTHSPIAAINLRTKYIDYERLPHIVRVPFAPASNNPETFASLATLGLGASGFCCCTHLVMPSYWQSFTPLGCAELSFL